LHQDAAWLDAQVGQEAYEVAKELTQLWAKRGELKTDSAYPNGRVAREIRPKSR
jgi:hypothetical protein